jgi:hypothetical protein
MNPMIRDFITSKDFITSLVIAVLSFIVGKGWDIIRRFVQAFRQTLHDFTISGFWVGTCALPSSKNDRLLEVWRLSQKREQVYLSFFVYHPSGDGSIGKYSGTGVFRGEILSAVYYSLLPENCESGVLALRFRAKRLSGVYAQFDLNSPEQPVFVSDPTFALHRTRLSPYKAFRFALGKMPFASYEEAAQFFVDSPVAKDLPKVA